MIEASSRAVVYTGIAWLGLGLGLGLELGLGLGLGFVYTGIASKQPCRAHWLMSSAG